MHATPRKLLIAIPFTLLFAAASYGQTSAIAGDIKGEDGKPTVGVQVKIDRIDIKASYKVKSDKKGHYYYGGLPLGTYNVAVEIDGKTADIVNGVRSRLGDTAEINFDLAAAKARASAPAGAAPPEESEKGMTPEQKAAAEKQRKEAEAAIAKNKALNDAFNIGKEAVAAKNWAAAVDGFAKASELDATQHVVWSNLADAYNSKAMMQGESPADKQADLEKGLAAYKKAIELKGDDPAYHNNYALMLANAKKFDEAQAELTKAAQLDPTQAGKYYYNLGAVYVNTGQAEPSGAAFRKAIELDQNYADAHYQYGLYLFGKATTAPDGKITPPPGTGEEFQKYLELRPDGQFADAAKAMMAAMGATVETNFERPGAKKQAPKKK